jgi:hypothetical protein
MSSVTVLEIALPEYTLEQEPDYDAIGMKLDRLIEAHFSGQRVAIRGISLFDHPGRTLDDLVATIIALGTDRYDPTRKGVHYPENAPSDMHALPCTVSSTQGLVSTHCVAGVMAEVIGDFYTGPPADRNYPHGLRLDILMLYHLDQLEGLTPDEPDQEPTVFCFRFPDRKPEALAGIIKMLP